MKMHIPLHVQSGGLSVKGRCLSTNFENSKSSWSGRYPTRTSQARKLVSRAIRKKRARRLVLGTLGRENIVKSDIKKTPPRKRFLPLVAVIGGWIGHILFFFDLDNPSHLSFVIFLGGGNRGATIKEMKTGDRGYVRAGKGMRGLGT